MRKSLICFALLAFITPGSSVLEASVVPDVLFETVFPDYGLAYGRAVVTDEAGNAYIAGNYHSANHNDIVISKVDAAGAILWETPISSSEIDIAQDIILDNDGSVLVVGFTDSPDFPVTADGLYTTMAGFRDAFLLRLSAADGAISYGTFLGGTHASYGNGVAVAADGTIWLVGSTDSPDFPTSPDAFQPGLGNYQYQYDDVFVAAIAADGQSLVYSTFLGASADDTAVGIALRTDETIVVVGKTNSPDFPGIDGFQPTLNMNSGDGFAAVIAPDGSALLHATYFGGELGEVVWGFDLGPDGSVHVAGLTSSESFPTTPDAVQPVFAGEVDGCEIPFAGDRNCYDGFLARISPDLGTLVFGTYMGGEEDDVFDGVAVDADGGVHVSGWSYSPDFPVTSGPAGPGIIAAQLDRDGTDAQYAVLLDADGSSNTGHAITVGPMGATVYLTGAKHVPAQVYVTRLTGAGLLFADGFESGDTAAWTR